MEVFDNAKPLTAQELKELCGVEGMKNPVGRLYWLEMKGMNGDPDFVLPLYILTAGKDATPGYDKPEKPDGADWLSFPGAVVLWDRSGVRLERAFIHERDLFVSQRIWDRPPSKEALKKYPPLVSGGTQ